MPTTTSLTCVTCFNHDITQGNHNSFAQTVPEHNLKCSTLIMDTAKTQSPAHDRLETYIADRTGTSKLGRRVLTKRQTAEPNRLSFSKAQDAQKAKFSYGKPLSESEPSVSEEDGKRGPGQPIDWLLATAAVLEQDIESSKKELELIRWILEDIDQRLQTNQKPSSRKLRSQKALMAACREYADSMIQVCPSFFDSLVFQSLKPSDSHLSDEKPRPRRSG